MSMYPLLFTLSSLLVLAVIALSTRPISAVSIYGLGTIIYGMPLFFGLVAFISSYKGGPHLFFAKLDPRVYFIFWAAQLVFFIAASARHRPNLPSSPPSPLFYQALIVAHSAFFVLDVITAGPANLMLVDKNAMLSHLSVFYYFAAITAVEIFIFYTLYPHQCKKRYLIIPIAFCILDLVIGMRSTVFLGLISGFVAYFDQVKQPIRRKTKVIVGCVGGLLVLIAFLYKPIYFSIKEGNPLSLRAIAATSLFGSEPFVITGVLNEVIKKNLEVPDGYLVKTLVQYAPFYEEATGKSRVSFNEYSQKKLFPDTEWGLASTAFGELYATGRMTMVAAFLGAIFLFLRMRPSRSHGWRLFYYYILPYVVFYFYRNDWHYVIGTARLYFLASIVVIGCYEFLRLVNYALSRDGKESPSSSSAAR